MVLKIIITFLIALFMLSVNVQGFICGIYFTDSTSADCQIIDNYIHNEVTLPANITLIEYDISNPVNLNIGRDFLTQYFLSDSYSFPDSVPFILFDADHHLAGMDEIKECLSLKVDQFLQEGGNPCPVLIYPDPSKGDSSDDMYGGGPQEYGFPGEPEIKNIVTDSPKEIIEPEEGIGYYKNDSLTEQIEKSKDVIENEIKEKKDKETEKQILESIPFIYMLLLGLILIAAYVLYKKRSG